jgi:putative sigma-54 modulation protein
MTAQVTLSVEGLDHVVDVRVQSGSSTFHANERSEDMYASIDMVMDKLERQVHAQKGANVAKKHGGMSAGEFAVIAERESQRGTRG